MAKSAMSRDACAELKHMNGDCQIRRQKSSYDRYKWLSLLFAILNAVWIILLIYLITKLRWPEKEACEPTETGEKTEERMCLPCHYLAPTQGLCCANSTQQWQNYVTAFVNAEFASSKRSQARSSPKGKARSKRSLQDPQTEQADYDLPSKTVEESGNHIVNAELTLDFLQPDRTHHVNCSIMRRQRDTTFVLFGETVVACLVKTKGGTCTAPVTMGGQSFLETNDEVYLHIEQLKVLNVTTKALTMVKL